MLRVCIVTHVLAPWDGQGRVNYELARRLAQRGHGLTLVASSVADDLLSHPNVRWKRINVPTNLPDPLQWVIFAFHVRRYLTKHRLKEFDIVHLNGAIAPVRADINTCHFVHAAWSLVQARQTIYQKTVTSVAVLCERAAYKGPRRVVAVSDQVARDLVAKVGVPARGIKVISNGVDDDEFHPAAKSAPTPLRSSLGLPADAFLTLFVGDAKSTRKNLGMVLLALQSLPARFHLAVIGPAAGGPFPATAARLGLSSRVHFLGVKQSIAGILREGDALLCPSLYEPASLVLLEAMATGLPVICSKEVGNAVFVCHGVNGFVLTSGLDHAEAAALLAKLGNDEGLRTTMGAAARDSMLTLTWERMAAEYESEYEAIVMEREKQGQPRRAFDEPQHELVLRGNG